MIKKTLTLLICLSCLSLSLLARGITENPDKEEGEEQPTVQELYDEMDDTVPVVGFFAPQYREGVDGEEVQSLFRDLTETLVLRGTMKPGNLEEWMSAAYEQETPRGILELNEALSASGIPLDFIASMNIFTFKKQYMFRLSFYIPGKLTRTVYVYRILKNLEKDWRRQLPGILDELDYRLAHNRQDYLSDTIYVEPFSLRFFDYYELKNGEYAFTELPFMTFDDRDYREGDDPFSGWLGLRLHLSGYFPVVIHDLDGRVADERGMRTGCTWGIKGEVRISEVLSVLRLNIYNYSRQDTVAVYDFPFEGMKIEEVSGVIDTVIPFVMDRVLSNEARETMTVVAPEFKHKKGTQVYRESGYQGPVELIGAYPARVGLNRFLVVKDKFNPADLSGFNETLLIGPEGGVFHSFTEKEIHYAEKIFE